MKAAATTNREAALASLQPRHAMVLAELNGVATAIDRNRSAAPALRRRRDQLVTLIDHLDQLLNRQGKT